MFLWRSNIWRAGSPRCGAGGVHLKALELFVDHLVGIDAVERRCGPASIQEGARHSQVVTPLDCAGSRPPRARHGFQRIEAFHDVRMSKVFLFHLTTNSCMPVLFLIELFSGTGSFGASAKKEAVKRGYAFQNLSVDIHPKYNPSTCIDIRKWNYRQEINDFLPKRMDPSDVLWVHASPPCNEYSVAKTGHPRDLDFADSLVKQALRIIKYCNPHFWTVENPVGLLYTRPFMRRLERFKHKTSYCKWGRPFRKNTHIWSNVELHLPVCQDGNQCNARKTLGHHPSWAQTRDATSGRNGALQKAPSRDQLYALPPGLVRHIVRSALS